MYDRSQQPQLGSFLEEDDIREEEEEESPQLNDSSQFTRPKLSDLEEGNCGYSISYAMLIRTLNI